MSDPLVCQECGAHVKAVNEATHMRRVHPGVPYHPPKDRVGAPRKRNLYVTSRTKKAVFVVLIAVVMIVAGAMLYLSTQRALPLDPNAQQVHISMAGWDPARLITKVGTPLKIDVMAMDDAHGAGHDFVLEALNINEYVGSTQKVLTLPANQPGQYSFYCSLCCGGKDSPSMVGTYAVEG